MQASEKRKIEFDQRLEQSKTLLDNSRIVEAEKNTEKILEDFPDNAEALYVCLLYTSPSPRDRTRSRMPSSA